MSLTQTSSRPFPYGRGFGFVDICKDFIVINIDLILNNIEGGEYILSITNSGETYSYLTEVQDYTVTQDGTGIYSDSVRFTDL